MLRCLNGAERMTALHAQSLSRSAILAYGAMGLPLAFAALPIYVHLPRFYADTTGMDLGWLGAILLGARLFDAVMDPCLGWAADRWPRRIMLKASIPIFMFGFIALLYPPVHGAGGWLLVSLLVTYLGFSTAQISYQAWGAALGGHSAQRTHLSAAREGFGLLGVVLAAALPTVLASDPAIGVQRLSWVFPPLLLLAAWATFSHRSEGEVHQQVQSQSLFERLRACLSDASFRRLLMVFVANGISAALPSTLFLFFVADVLGRSSASGPLLALYFVAGAASLPMWVALAARKGRVVAWLLAMLLAIVAFAGTFFLQAGDVLPFAVICLLSGLALGADLALPAAMAADMGEALGQTGTCFGVWNFVSKLNLALAAGLALPMLDALGYRAGSSDGLDALRFTYALLPLAFKCLAVCLLWRWRRFLEIRT